MGLQMRYSLRRPAGNEIAGSKCDDFLAAAAAIQCQKHALCVYVTTANTQAIGCILLFPFLQALLSSKLKTKPKGGKPRARMCHSKQGARPSTGPMERVQLFFGM